MPGTLPRLLLLGLATATPIASTRAANADPLACTTELAQTRNYTLGRPISAAVTPDGRRVVFLRSGPTNTVLHLYAFDIASGRTTELAGTATADEHLSTEERARRERARQSLSGTTAFLTAPDSRSVIAITGSHLARIDLATGQATPIPGDWIAPRQSPDGTRIAAVKNDDLFSIDPATGQTTQLATGGQETLTHGLAEFAAAEELQREDGTWWSPDGQTLLFEEADSSKVEPHYIANLGNPSTPPVEFRYPRAGTTNATTRLKLIAATGGPARQIDWDHDRYPYLARVVWRKVGGLVIVLLNREQTDEILLSVDPKTAATHEILHDHDASWLSLTPWEGSGGHALPVLREDGSFLWAAQRGAHWSLELHDANGKFLRNLTPPGLPFVALNTYDARTGSVVATVQTTRTDTNLVRIDIATGKITKLTTDQGLHTANFTPGNHDIFIDTHDSADGTHENLVRRADGTILGHLPSAARTPDIALHTQFLTLGQDALDALIVRPDHFDPKRKYPVLLSVYAGPGYKTVWHTPGAYYENQCIANQGFIVASFDGHGTPGRDHDFERATKNNLIDLPLHDQIEGLQAAAAKFPEIDLRRAGVYGWSFGGYFTAMATIRRPDIFQAGNAGAPPVDWTDYDTAYTERYLGTPQVDPAGYRVSNVLTYAPQLSRPLLIMHGATDDNVYFANTMKLTQSLLAAGKPYDLLLLPGTHMLPNAAIRARVTQARIRFFTDTLHP